MFKKFFSKVKEVWNTPLKPLSFQITRFYDDVTGESGPALVHFREITDQETGGKKRKTYIMELSTGWIFAL